jgi:hypothetical protein
MPHEIPFQGGFQVFNTPEMSPGWGNRTFSRPRLLEGHVAEARNPDQLSQRERDVIDALNRPLREDGPGAAPATNQKIAGEVFLSLDAVKGHLRTIYAKLGLDELPQNQKRTELARLAHSGELESLLAERAAAAEEAAAATAAAERRHGWRQLTPTMVLGGLALVLLAALAVARVVPGERAPADQAVVVPGGPDRAVTVPRQEGTAKKGSVLLEGMLPASFSTDVVEEGGSGGGEETGTTEVVPPVEKKLKRAEGRVKKNVGEVKKAVPAVPAVTAPATVTAPAPKKVVHCVNHVTRVTKRVVVWRKVPRRVKVRKAHRKVRIERTVYYTRKKVVTYDKKGRKHVTWVRVRHVRITRHPYIVYRVHYKRRMVRVRKVVTRVQLVNHRRCS